MKFTNTKPLDFETMISMFSKFPPPFIHVPLEFKIPAIIRVHAQTRIKAEFQYDGLLYDNWRNAETPEAIRITVHQ